MTLGAGLAGLPQNPRVLNGVVYPTQVAEWAGHSMDVLLRTACNSSTVTPAWLKIELSLLLRS